MEARGERSRKQDLQEVEPSQAVGEFVNCEGKGGPQGKLDEATQPSDPLPPPPAQPLQTACPLRAISTTHPGNSSPEQQHVPVLDAVLKNQEVLLMVLKNQDILKGVVEKLQKTMSTIEERVQAIEQEMSAFTQFTQELYQVGNEANWG